MVRSCARRNFAAETIFMALVICCVFFTERMRRRMSIRLGMRYFVLRYKPRFELFDHGLDLGGQVVIQRLLGGNFFEDSAVRILYEAVQLLLELAALVDGEIVQIALGAGPDD